MNAGRTPTLAAEPGIPVGQRNMTTPELYALRKDEAWPYLEAIDRFDPHLEAVQPEWLRRERLRALGAFGDQGFPDRKNEAWRYLDLRPLIARPMLPAPAAPVDVAAVQAALSGFERTGTGPLLVIVDGRFCQGLSSVEVPAGIWFGSMARAIVERPEFVRGAFDAVAHTLGQASLKAPAGKAPPGFKTPWSPFDALNWSYFSDGFLLQVGAGIDFDSPIEIIHVVSAAADCSVHTRSLVALEPGSRATLLESHIGAGRYWRNDAVTLTLADNAALDRAVLVEEGAEAVHFDRSEVFLGPQARLASFALLLGGRTVRHEAAIDIAGPGARCQFDGAFVVSGRDETNIVTTIDHRARDGETREFVKGVAAGRGHGAFQGRILVREGAQKVDARQTSRNLLLGRQAVIDTKPELEIYADDVKCSHGATVGDLDEAALFYLRARGIPAAEARRMLIEAFMRDAVERVASAPLREHLLRRLEHRLAALEG